MPFIIDYKEEVKALIKQSYKQSDVVSQEFKLTTSQIVENLQQIMPEQSIDGHLVYEALIELGFEPKEEKPLSYYWYFQRI